MNTSPAPPAPPAVSRQDVACGTGAGNGVPRRAVLRRHDVGFLEEHRREVSIVGYKGKSTGNIRFLPWFLPSNRRVSGDFSLKTNPLMDGFMEHAHDVGVPPSMEPARVTGESTSVTPNDLGFD